MSSAIYVVPFQECIDERIMDLLQADTVEERGWGRVGQVPLEPTCLIHVWASDEVLDAVAALSDVLFMEDIEVIDVTTIQSTAG